MPLTLANACPRHEFIRPAFLHLLGLAILSIWFFGSRGLAQSPVWSNGIIDYGLDSSNVFCAVAHNKAGETIGFWRDGADASTVYKLVKWNGSSWTLLSGFTGQSSLAGSAVQDDVALAVDSVGGYHVAFRLNSNSADLVNGQRVVMYGYSANGTTWTFKEVWRTASSPSGFYNTDDPQIRLDSNDRPHVAFRYTDANGSRYYAIRHHYYNGSSWVGEVAYGQSGGASSSNEITKYSYQLDQDDKSHLAITVELNGSGTDGSLGYLNNVSGTWSSPSILAAGATSSAAAVNISLAIDRANKVHIVRQDIARVLHYHTNASGTFSGSPMGAGISGALDHGSLSINSGDHLFVAYNASPTTTNIGAVAYASLPKGAASWSSGTVFSGGSNTMRFWGADLDDDGDATILFDHFSGTGSPGTGNPRQAHYAKANITTLAVVTATAPIVASSAASGLNSTAANLAGNVTSDGGSAITGRGFVYAITSQNADPSIGAPSVTDLAVSGTTGSFSGSATGLLPGTSYTFRAYATNSIGTSYGETLVFTTWTHHQAWRATHFGTIESQGSAADLADPEGDGIPNLLEYALGLDPHAGNLNPAAIKLSQSGVEYTYDRDGAAKQYGMSYEVVWSDTLEPGSWSASGVTQDVISEQGGIQKVKAVVPIGNGPKRFVRLRVSESTH